MEMHARQSKFSIVAAMLALLPAGCCDHAMKAAAPAAGPSTRSVAAAPAPAPATQSAVAWESLFDGKTLTNWRPTEFGGSGEIEVKDGLLMIGNGERLSGVVWEGEDLPHVNYEISLEAKRINGSDFFCGLTFPVKDSFATLVVGGWGGALIGISSIDDEDAGHNDTATSMRFDTNKWYRIRMRILADKLQTWINDENMIDYSTFGKKVDIRVDISDSKPLGLTSFSTTAAMRDIKLRKLTDAEVAAAKKAN